MDVGDAVGSVLVVGGAVFALLAAIGPQRFDSVFARMHAATKAATLGLMLTVLGASLRLADPADAPKLLLVLALQVLTAPVGAHLVGRAAYRSGDQLSPHTTVDEMAGTDDDPTADGGPPRVD